ncbi:hypothetical protein ACFQPF_02570 [Fictibacillus iocasae]|uniref:3-methyladenine DNA glycosylase n=1 Tax=Fictibacillus iocasae TaxID=2715437 RepID=A0ABW2NM68_9BACL
MEHKPNSDSLQQERTEQKQQKNSTEEKGYGDKKLNGPNQPST